MELQVKKREWGMKRLRREGQIPVIIYADKSSSELVAVDRLQFEKLLHTVSKGHLPTTVFTLVGEKGKKRQAIVKEIQYHLTSYNILHIDFEELKPKVPVKVKVPVECLGTADCVGVKQGGVLRQPVRHVKVSCLPKKIPEKFELDVQHLELNQHAKLSALTIPEGVKPLTPMQTIIAVVAKR